MEGILVGRFVFHGVTVDDIVAVRVGPPGSGDAVEVPFTVAVAATAGDETIASTSGAAQLDNKIEMMHSMVKTNIDLRSMVNLLRDIQCFPTGIPA
jgi:hypothetical protein